MNTYQINQQSAICAKCGHGSGTHTTTNCANFYKLGQDAARCDCTGWQRDLNWPPPVVLERK